MKQSLYLETTVPSYYIARVSRDVVAVAHQEITREWWETRISKFDVYISPVVIEESARGDQEQAKKRLAVIDSFPVLSANEYVEQLAELYVRRLSLPPKALRDAAHLAFACYYQTDYLVTWNCAHIANAEIMHRLMMINMEINVHTPIVCTPEELMGEEDS